MITYVRLFGWMKVHQRGERGRGKGRIFEGGNLEVRKIVCNVCGSVFHLQKP